MLIVNDRACALYLRMIEHTRLTIKSDVYEALVNLVSSFREGPFLCANYSELTLTKVL